MTTTPTPITAEERAEAGGLAARLRALAQRIPFTGASEWWALRETYEDAMRQAADVLDAADRKVAEATAQLRAAAETNVSLVRERDEARTQVATFAKMLNDRRDADRDNADRARAALTQAGLGPAAAGGGTMTADMARAWAAWEAIERCSAAAEFKLVGDYEGLWSCTVSWTNEAEAKRGFAQNQTTAAEAILAAVVAAEDTP